MIFKGTNKRSAYSWEEEIENLGAKLNLGAKDIDIAIDVLADILQNCKFPEHAIRRERGVILREMEEVQGNMEEVIFDHLHTAAFPSHPLGDTILGPEENIHSISKSDLKQYISTHYTGPRMVLSFSSCVLSSSLFRRSALLLGGLVRGVQTDGPDFLPPRLRSSSVLMPFSSRDGKNGGLLSRQPVCFLHLMNLIAISSIILGLLFFSYEKGFFMVRLRQLKL